MSFLSLPAQSPSSTSDTRPDYPPLFPLRNGWVGVEEGLSFSRLIFYDSLFTILSQEHWSDLVVDDIAPATNDSDTRSGLLLGEAYGVSVLYAIVSDSANDLRLLWQASGRGYDKIIPIDDNRLSPVAAIISGDSGIVAFDERDSIVYTLRAHLRAEPIVLGSNELFIVVTDLSGTSIQWIDARSGAMTGRLDLASGGDILVPRLPVGASPSSIVVTTSMPPMLYDVRMRSRGFAGRYPLERSPDFLLPLASGAVVPLRYALIFQEYPSPSYTIWGDPELRRHRLDYPSVEVIESATSIGGKVLLLGRTKGIIYDAELRLIDAVDVVGGSDPWITPMGTNAQGDSLRLLLRTSNGSAFIDYATGTPRWWSTYWKQMLIGLGVVLLLGLLVLLWRRSNSIRSVYLTLVRGRDATGIIVLSQRGKVLQMNGVSALLFGIDRVRHAGQHISHYLTRSGLSMLLDSVRTLLTIGVPFEREVVVDREGEKRTIRFRGRRLLGRFGGRSGYLIQIEDFTDAIERERLVNWASVAHHIAHEMKTPLGTIRTSADMLRADLSRVNDSGRMVTTTSRILRQSIRLREIVDDLLSIARTEELRRTEVELSLYVPSLIDDFREYLHERIELRYHPPATTLRLAIDADQIGVALRNIIDNAAQAIRPDEPGTIIVRLEDLGEEILLHVEDDGIGMSPETLERLFQPYYTEKEGGSGIGTIIIKRVVEGHGGRIDVQSLDGSGTIVRVYLPK